MVDDQTSKVDAKLSSVNRDHEILYADRSSKDEQLLIRPLQNTKMRNMVGS
jgi:hypothetical protein